MWRREMRLGARPSELLYSAPACDPQDLKRVEGVRGPRCGQRMEPPAVNPHSNCRRSYTGDLRRLVGVDRSARELALDGGRWRGVAGPGTGLCPCALEGAALVEPRATANT